MSKKWFNNDGIAFNTEKERDIYDAEREYQKNRILKATKGNFVDFTADRKARTASQKFIIDKIMPEGEIHILAGPSGVGKSTLLLPVLKAIQNGEPIWGFKTEATPLVYIMCDSSSTSLERKLQRIGLADWHIPAYALEDLRKEPFDLIPSETEIWDLPGMFPWAKLFVIEAFGWFYRDKSSNGSKDYVDTMRFWSRVRSSFGAKNLTILGTTHMAKHKKGEGYENTRDKVFGSVAQSASTYTVMTLEESGESDSKRILTVEPRDWKKFAIEFWVDGSGVLQYIGNVEEKEDNKQEEKIQEQTSMRMFDSKLASYKDGDVLLGSTIRDWYHKMDFSRATVNRWLTVRVKDGTLERIDVGVYKVHKTTEQ